MAEEKKKIEIVTARLGDLHMSPRKVRLITDSIKKKSALEAQTILKFMVKKASNPVLKLLNSAIANAEHNFGLDKSSLFIKDIIVNQGRVMSRFMPRAQGRAFMIKKRSSVVDITLGVDEKLKKLFSRKSIKVKIAGEKIPQQKAENSSASGNDSETEKTVSTDRQKPKAISSGRKGFWKGPVNLKRRLFDRKTNA